MSGRSAKRKGQQGEYELRDFLRECGWASDRVPGSGAFIGLPHDVTARCGGIKFDIEVKRRKELPKTFEEWKGAANVLAMRADRGEWRFYFDEDTLKQFLTFVAEKAA